MPAGNAAEAVGGAGLLFSGQKSAKTAQLLVQTRGGTFPREAKELEKLPGIGPYTAGAIASIAFGEPEPAVDGNVLRILSRLFDDERDVLQPATQKHWREFLRQQELIRPGDLNQSFMDLGSLVCLPEGSRCESCPLGVICLARQRGTQVLRPVRTQKKPRRMER